MCTSVLVVAGSPATAHLANEKLAVPSSGGTQVWVARDTGAHNAYDRIGGMVTSPDGSTVYVARTSAGKFAVVAHDALTGARRWSVKTVDPGGLQIFAEAVAISPDGTRLFVTGDVEQSTSTRSGRTVAYDTTDGSVVWTTDIVVPANREIIPRSITVSPDGTRVFVTGSRTGANGTDDFWDYDTFAYSEVTGDPWSGRRNTMVRFMAGTLPKVSVSPLTAPPCW
jgi:DNA-binding beta-propeller fold protein YncE